jgi:hypothetical protein
MLLAPLFGTALMVAVSTDPSDDLSGPARLTVEEKHAAAERLVRSATQCIVRAVIANPRYVVGKNANIGDLIVDSMHSCLQPVRAMIDGYDRYYGEGSGEAFFMGPYLDVLPKAVIAGAKEGTQLAPAAGTER